METMKGSIVDDAATHEGYMTAREGTGADTAEQLMILINLEPGTTNLEPWW